MLTHDVSLYPVGKDHLGSSVRCYQNQRNLFKNSYLFIWPKFQPQLHMNSLPWHVGSSSLNQRLNPGPLHWELRSLATGPLGKSPEQTFWPTQYLNALKETAMWEGSHLFSVLLGKLLWVWLPTGRKEAVFFPKFRVISKSGSVLCVLPPWTWVLHQNPEAANVPNGGGYLVD